MNLIKNLLHSFRSVFQKMKVRPGQCQTRYPIILVHGISIRDSWSISSWGRIPKYLSRGGADVYLGQTQAWASYKTNAKHIRDKVDEILLKTGKSKVNIIAHSKGGVDARYAIAQLDLGEKVASLTTVSTPHRGTCAADMAMQAGIPESGFKLADFLAGLFGDSDPQVNEAIRELSRENMERFNEQVKDVKNVYYQSYGARMLKASDDPLFPYNLVKKIEGDNDGLIAVDSMRWGDFQQIVEAKDGKSGISHGQISGIPGDMAANTNVALYYVRWVEALKARGF